MLNRFSKLRLRRNPLYVLTPDSGRFAYTRFARSASFAYAHSLVPTLTRSVCSPTTLADARSVPAHKPSLVRFRFCVRHNLNIPPVEGVCQV